MLTSILGGTLKGRQQPITDRKWPKNMLSEHKVVMLVHLRKKKRYQTVTDPDQYEPENIKHL